VTFSTQNFNTSLVWPLMRGDAGKSQTSRWGWRQGAFRHAFVLLVMAFAFFGCAEMPEEVQEEGLNESNVMCVSNQSQLGGCRLG